MEEPLLEVGRIARPHGVRGDVLVALVTNVLERVAPGSVLLASAPGAPGVVAPRELRVVRSSAHQRRYIVAFEGVTTREGAEALHGWLLSAPPLPGAGGGSFFVHELIGSAVRDLAGTLHGRVTAVEANPASDLLVVEGRWYVPLRFVVEQREGELVVDVPEGIFG